MSVTILIVCVHSPLQDRLNSNSPGEDLDDWDDKDASGMDQVSLMNHSLMTKFQQLVRTCSITLLGRMNLKTPHSHYQV